MNAAPLTPKVIDKSTALILNIFKRFRPTILERAGKSAHTTKTHDGSPVTATDLEIEQALQSELAQAFPDLPVFGEETGYKNSTLPYACWLVDPLDGTKSFIANVPTFTSMAVLIQNKEAIAALIYNPSTNHVYMAKKGEGAFKNNVRLNLKTMPLPQVALCKKQFIEELNTMLKPKGVTCEEPPAGGGFGFTQVIEGLAAARFQLWGGGYTHDYAPGGLLVREAGGVIMPILDKEYTFQSSSFVACHPQLEATLLPHIPRLRELELQNDKK